jgi:hypothetical protein
VLLQSGHSPAVGQGRHGPPDAERCDELLVDFVSVPVRPAPDARQLRLATRKLTLEFGVELSTDLSYVRIAELFKQ